MQQNEDLNFLKGIGIVFVVLGHCFTTKLQESYTIIAYSFAIIYSFHMPLFFMVSGYIQGLRTYNIGKFKKFSVHHAKKQLLPYVLWSILLYAFFYVLQTMSFVKIPEKISLNPVLLFQDIMSYNVRTGNVLWFVYILFIISVVSYLIHSFLHNKYINFAFLFLVLILGFTANRYFGDSVFVLKRFLVMWIYYEVGVFIGKYVKDIQVKANLKQMILLLGAYIVFFSGYINTNGYVANSLKFIGALTAVYIIYSLSRYNLSRFYKLFNYIGKRTFYIYYMHNPYIVLILVTALSSFTPIHIIGSISVAFILGCSLPIIIGELIFNRSRTVSSLLLGGNK